MTILFYESLSRGPMTIRGSLTINGMLLCHWIQWHDCRKEPIVETIDVVAAIIRHDDKIFATQRGYGDFAGGWEFPGGKIEPGETPEAALEREIREELATRIAVDSHFMTVEYDYPAFHLSMRCYLCHVVEGDLTLLEHASARWLDASTIDEVAWLPADGSIIERIKSELFRC